MLRALNSAFRDWLCNDMKFGRRHAVTMPSHFPRGFDAPEKAWAGGGPPMGTLSSETVNDEDEDVKARARTGVVTIGILSLNFNTFRTSVGDRSVDLTYDEFELL